MIGLAVGVVLAGRWDVVRSPWVWAAAGIALLIWAPNLAWQATHGLPQLTMAHVIAGDAAANRAQLLPVLWLFTGPLLFAITLAGWAWMLLAKTAAPWRAVAIAAVIVLALVVASGGKGYYAVGVAPPLMAAGALLLDRWLARGRRRLRAVSFIAAAAVSGALVAYLTLPILPVAAFATTSLPAQIPTSAEQIGWPQLVAQVQQVVAALPAQERAHAVILTDNYGEAGRARAARQGAAPGLLGPQRLLVLGTAPGRPHCRGARGRLDEGRLEPVLHGLPHRRAHRQRARCREPGAGPGDLGVPRPTHAVGGDLAETAAPVMMCDD